MAMETNDEIEMLLWEYIDGICGDAENQRISGLILQDPVWRQKYEELSSLHSNIAAMQAEQPSMRFTKNVMEAVAATHIAPATKKYINKSVIRSIAAFFIISIALVLGYAFATADWSISSGHNIAAQLPRVDIGSYYNSSTISIFIAINVALALILLDGYLSRKSNKEKTA